MCGRFTSTFEFSDIRVRWNLDRDLPLYTPRFNVAPETSPNIPVIIRHQGGNECRLMHWGLIPYWAADPSIGNRMINARAETLTELPSFKLLVDRRRCIIPADGFYEWRKEGKRKVPMWVHLRNREPFGLAGLWDVCGASRTGSGCRVDRPRIAKDPDNDWIPFNCNCGTSCTRCAGSWARLKGPAARPTSY
jgi:putative SOS response-associated peptidase YedK